MKDKDPATKLRRQINEAAGLPRCACGAETGQWYPAQAVSRFICASCMAADATPPHFEVRVTPLGAGGQYAGTGLDRATKTARRLVVAFNALGFRVNASVVATNAIGGTSYLLQVYQGTRPAPTGEFNWESFGEWDKPPPPAPPPRTSTKGSWAHPSRPGYR